jgi:uncharacterized protein YjdB
MRHSARGAVLLATLLASCDRGSPVDPAVPPDPHPPVAPVAAFVQVLPSADTLVALGRQIRLTLEVKDSTGASLDGFTTVWSSSDSSVIGVDGEGTATAEATGSAQVTATVDGVQGHAELAVIQVPARIAVTPPVDTLEALGSEVELTGEVQDSTAHAIPGVEIVWSSSDSAVVHVSEVGTARAVGQGSATVTASHGPLRGTAELVVRQRPAQLTLAPEEVTLLEGRTVGLDVSVADAGGAPVPGVSPTWSSADPSVATVSQGVVRGMASGVTWIRASLEGLSDSTRVRVQEYVPPPEPFLDVVPDTIRLDSWYLRFTVRAYLDDGTGERTEVSAKWATRDMDVVARVPPGGRFETQRDGETWVVANYQGKSDSARVLVKRIPVRWVVAPSSLSLGVGGVGEIDAYTVDRAGTPIRPRSTEWVVRDPQVAALTGGGIEGLARGSTWVTAAAEGFVDSLHVTVSDFLDGSVTVRTLADLDRLHGVSRVAGSVRIEGSDLSVLPDLGDVTRIDRDLVIAGNASLVEVSSLPLVAIGGALRVAENPVLRRLGGFPELGSVGGSMLLEDNPALDLPPFPALTRIGGLRLRGNAGIEDGAILQGLAEVDADIDVRQGPVFQFTALRRLGGQIHLGSPGPAGFEAPALEGLVAITIRQAAELQELRLPSLTSVAYLRVWNNPRLTAIDLPSLNALRVLEIIENPSLRSLRLPRVEQTHLTVGDNPLLEELALDDLKRVERFSIRQGNLRTLTVPETIGDEPQVLISHMPVLEEVTVHATRAEDISFDNSPHLTSISVPEAVDVHYFTLSSLITLRTFEAPQLEELRALTVYRTALEQISFPRLERVTESIGVASNPYLESSGIDLPRLHLVRMLTVLLMQSITDLSPFSGLTSSMWQLNLVEDPALSDISALGSLGDAEGKDPIVLEVNIYDNPALPASKVQQLLDSLEAKYEGSAFGRINVSRNGPG